MEYNSGLHGCILAQSSQRLSEDLSMFRHRYCLLILLTFLIASLSTIYNTPASADSKLGLVLMHGKTGTPYQFKKLATALKSAGYLVETPEMCWSKNRIFDKNLTGCF